MCRLPSLVERQPGHGRRRMHSFPRGSFRRAVTFRLVARFATSSFLVVSDQHPVRFAAIIQARVEGSSRYLCVRSMTSYSFALDFQYFSACGCNNACQPRRTAAAQDNPTSSSSTQCQLKQLPIPHRKLCCA